MTDLLRSSLTEKIAALADKRLSAVELCQEYLKRIDSIDSQLGSFLHLSRETALASAAKVDAKRAEGQSLGPLAGIPIGIKDLLVTKGMPTTAASKILEGWVPPYNATVVERLLDQEVVILGKLNMDEFAMGSSNEHSAYKECKNPWDLSRVPGGSSGGSAVAVAADLCAISLGTDTGGSIRQPASFCGILGIKPSYGRVSRYGLIAYASSLDQIGPMARHAEDAALLLDSICGGDPKDATSIHREKTDFSSACKRELKGLRIGIAKEMSGGACNPEVQNAVDRALSELEKAGAILKEISLPHTQYALPTYYLLATAEASSNLSRYDGVRFGPRYGEEGGLRSMYECSRSEGFGSEVKRRIMLGTYALRAGHYDAYYKKAQQVRTLIARDFSEAFREVDLIASPTSPTTAFSRGEKSRPIDMYQADIYTLSCNLAGLPGMSIPCGFDSKSLPIGLQLLAPSMAEDELFRCAANYQNITDWHLQRPENLA